MANSMTPREWAVLAGAAALGLGKLYYAAKHTTTTAEELWKKPKPWQIAVLLAAVAYVLFLYFGPY
jgi:hypothetical protein